jgi:hypothetical protein
LPENQLSVIAYQVLVGFVVATFSSYQEMPDTVTPQQSRQAPKGTIIISFNSSDTMDDRILYYNTKAKSSCSFIQT